MTMWNRLKEWDRRTDLEVGRKASLRYVEQGQSCDRSPACSSTSRL